MTNLPKRLRELIENNNFSKRYIAERLNVSPDLVSKWCSDNPKTRRDPNTEHLSALADLFCVSTDYLLGRTHITYNKTEEEILNSLELSDIDELIKKHGISIDDKRYTMQEIKAMIHVLKSVNNLNKLL